MLKIVNNHELFFSTASNKLVLIPETTYATYVNNILKLTRCLILVTISVEVYCGKACYHQRLDVRLYFKYVAGSGTSMMVYHRINCHNSPRIYNRVDKSPVACLER